MSEKQVSHADHVKYYAPWIGKIADKMLLRDWRVLIDEAIAPDDCEARVHLS